jgi:hypothetical protein
MRLIALVFAASAVFPGGSALAATRTYVCTMADGVSDIFYIDAQNHTVTSAKDGPVPVVSYQGSSTITFIWSDANNTLNLRTGKITNDGDERLWAKSCAVK